MFEQQLKNYLEKSSKNITEIQSHYLQGLIQLGLPNRKTPYWDTTNIKNILNNADFHIDLQSSTKTSIVKESDCLVFIDGILNSHLSDIPESIKINDLQIDQLIPKINNFFQTNKNVHYFLPLISGIHHRYYEINFTENIPTLVKIKNISTQNTLHHQPKVFQVADGINVHLVEEFQDISKKRDLWQNLSYFQLNSNSQLNYAVSMAGLNTEMIQLNVLAELGKASRFESLQFNQNNKKSRNHWDVHVNEEEAFAKLDFLNLLNQQEQTDNYVNIYHRKPNTQSEQLIKSSMDDQSKSIFTGKIHIAQDAQNVQASQLSKNLLLSDHAQAMSRPQLEVYADDVECAHGSTTGSLDEEQMFYLTSRGLSKNQAQEMLSQGFVLDIINKNSSELIKEYLLNKIENERSNK